MSWSRIERAAKERIEAVLTALHGARFTVFGLGGNDSTAPDVRVVDSVSGSVCNVEVKLLPSVAGIQVVVAEENGSLVLNNGVMHSFDEIVLALGNKFINFLNETIVLTGSDAVQALKAFELKYREENVHLFLGFVNSFNGFIGCKPTVVELDKLLTPCITVRRKKSGSARLPARLFETVGNVLRNAGLSIVKVDGKTFIQFSDAGKIATANQTLSSLGENVWVNSEGEIRKLSSTNNLNILLSFKVKDSVNVDSVLSDEMLEKLILQA